MLGKKYSIGIIGGGAVGLTYAALLSKAAPVRVLTRRQEQANHINTSGISFETRSGSAETYTGIEASSEPVNLKDCNALIIAVKSYDTPVVVTELYGVIKENMAILTLQNGIEAFSILQAGLPHPERVYAGVTYLGANRKDDRTVVNGDNFRTVIDSKAVELIEIMQQTKLTVEAQANIKQSVWDKLALNVAQNALSAVTNLDFGEMYESTECLDRAAKLLSEFKKVADAEGLHFNYDLMEKLKDNWRGSTFRPSMWQDLHRHRLTEIDAINGAISKLGKKYGIATPYNDEITAEIKALEESNKQKEAS